MNRFEKIINQRARASPTKSCQTASPPIFE